MIIWVLYDIKSDRARNRAARYCKQAGLYRIQFSAFIGRLDTHQKDELALKLQDQIDPNHDKVYILPMTREELRQTVLLGQAFDKLYVTDQVKSLFI